jgi:hypothetical protein
LCFTSFAASIPQSRSLQPLSPFLALRNYIVSDLSSTIAILSISGIYIALCKDYPFPSSLTPLRALPFFFSFEASLSMPPSSLGSVLA